VTISTGGKVCIFIGFIVMLVGLFVTMNTLVGLFMIFAGIVTMIQGNNMKATESFRALPKCYSNSHYNTGLGIKKDPNNKGAI